jgi:c-di-GMP-binding flagellar brake protein YcgR
MPSGELFSERRMFKRINTKVSVTYKVVSQAAEIESIKKETQRSITETINLSVGGIQLIDSIQLKPDMILRLEFRPQNNSAPIVTFAEVRWCAKDDDISKYRTGLEFLVLKDEDKNALQKIIDSGN